MPDVLEASPLTLVRWRPADVDEVLEAVRSSFAELQQWMHWAQTMPTREKQWEALTEGSVAFDAGTDFGYLFREAATGAVVGGGGVHRRVGPGAVEIGYWVRSDRHNRGYATRATEALTERAVGRSVGETPPTSGRPAAAALAGTLGPRPAPIPGLDREEGDDTMPTLRVVGPGRAGTALMRAATAAGWDAVEPVRRHDDPTGAARAVDLVVVAIPDAAVAEVAGAIEPVPTTVVAHLAGSLGLDVLAPHARRASLHPLVSIPSGDTSLTGAWFAVAGDPLVADLVAALGGRPIEVADEDRASYHAAAAIAANHLVALLGQVERVAATAGVPLEAYLDLVRSTVDNVAALGPAAALTGPVRRGDLATVERHLAALDPSERPAYEAMADAARRLVPCG